VHIDLTSEEKVKLLISVCDKMGVSADEVLSLFLVLGDGIFFLFDLFQDRTVKFPSVRSFHHAVSFTKGFNVKKLKKYHYLINGVDSYSKDIKRGDVVRVDGVDVVASGSPQEILGETYLLCEVKE